MTQYHPPVPVRSGYRTWAGAAALLAVVLLLLLFGYRDAAPAQSAAAGASVAAAAVDSEDYDLNRAMDLAGRQVPPDVESYYFFAFIDDTPAEQEIDELAQKLQQASIEHDFLGITGPDAERNRRNLLAALRRAAGKDLSGVVIIYLGPEAHRDELMRAVQAAGARLRFIVYPDARRRYRRTI